MEEDFTEVEEQIRISDANYDTQIQEYIQAQMKRLGLSVCI